MRPEFQDVFREETIYVNRSSLIKHDSLVYLILGIIPNSNHEYSGINGTEITSCFTTIISFVAGDVP